MESSGHAVCVETDMRYALHVSNTVYSGRGSILQEVSTRETVPKALALAQHLSLLLMVHVPLNRHVLLVVKTSLARIVLLHFRFVLVLLNQALSPARIDLLAHLPCSPLFVLASSTSLRSCRAGGIRGNAHSLILQPLQLLLRGLRPRTAHPTTTSRSLPRIEFPRALFCWVQTSGEVVLRGRHGHPVISLGFLWRFGELWVCVEGTLGRLVVCVRIGII